VGGHLPFLLLNLLEGRMSLRLLGRRRMGANDFNWWFITIRHPGLNRCFKLVPANGRACTCQGAQGHLLVAAG